MPKLALRAMALSLCVLGVAAMAQELPTARAPGWTAQKWNPPHWPGEPDVPKQAPPPVAVAPGKALVAPEFWGLDLIESFPEWKDRFINLSGVLAEPDGTLIARVDVTNPDGKGSRAWDLDVVRQTRTAVGNDSAAFARYRTGELTDDGHIVDAQARIIVGQWKPGGKLEPCEDPIRETYELQNLHRLLRGQPPVWETERSIIIVAEASNKQEGARIGGYCGDQGYVPVENFRNFVTSAGGAMFNLQDGTAIVQVGHGGAIYGSSGSALVRLDRDLSVHFSSRHFKVIDVAEYERLFNAKGIFAAQKQFLGMFR
jgi:hypothetical protein